MRALIFQFRLRPTSISRLQTHRHFEREQKKIEQMLTMLFASVYDAFSLEFLFLFPNYIIFIVVIIIFQLRNERKRRSH